MAVLVYTLVLFMFTLCLPSGLLQSTAEIYCADIKDKLTPEYFKIFNESSSIVREVDLEFGADNEECLNANGTSDPPPCQSLQYALHGDGHEEGVTPGVIVHVGPGVYRSTNLTTRVVDSERVAILGADPSRTTIVCGANGTADVPCSFPNFQIRNSSHVLVSGVTFTGCGPVTSSLYVAFSDYVFIENCIFENNLSPAALFHNTPNVRISNCTFRSNRPWPLDQAVVHSACYGPLEEPDNPFFIDNRTSGGAISYYSADAIANIFIQNGLFVNNSARPDFDLGLIRNSDVYSQGGAVSISLLNSTYSSVCIQESEFLENSAEAHAGALAITVANSSGTNFVIERSLFNRNKCQVQNCTGGAVGIYLFSNTFKSQMLFAGCNFTSNKAGSSGAVVLSTSVSARVEDGKSDILKFTECLFEENQAFYEGTALGAFSLTHTNLIGIPVVLDDCLFYNNQGTQGSRDTTAVTVYRVLLTLSGNTSFLSNQGGGVTLLSSRMDVRGTAVFDLNTAVFGAGVAMAGRSLMLLHENSSVLFSNNIAYEFGAGLYVEDPSSDFTLSIFNTGCFIRYNTSEVDLPPCEWNTSVIFENNTAFVAGAAIYANDMSRCLWVGSECAIGNLSRPNNRPTIFDLHPDSPPFEFCNNTVDIPGGGMPRGTIANQILATDPTTISAKVDYVDVGYGEILAVRLSSLDDQGNFREAVWSMTAPSQNQIYGALSSNNTLFTYTVPNKADLLKEPEALTVNGTTTKFSVTFTLLHNETAVQSAPVVLSISGNGCHPGYVFNNGTESCICSSDREIIRCDSNNRYFYTTSGLWVGEENDIVHFANIVPGFLECHGEGTLPGCEYRFDDPDWQCAPGRSGVLCGQCRKGLGVTFDLRYCRDCNVYGLLLFIFIIIITPIGSVAILYFDFPLPNELKGVLFYAQVVGVIYRSTPYLNDKSSNSFFDFIVNALGFAMPFPLCMHESLPMIAVAFMGYITPLLAILTAVAYWFCARHVKVLSHREQYGFHGFYFLLLIIYKYIIDTSFILVSCTNVNGKQVFLYQGEFECHQFPFVLVPVIGSIMLVIFGGLLPLYVLKLIYAPGKMIYVRNALTHGLKNKRRYLWYGVWDIWRRVLFVAANLFISITTRSVVVLIHCILILFCLWVVCFIRPYKKYHINAIEIVMVLSLFYTTLSVYGGDNDLHIGLRAGFVTFAIPYVLGVGFILFLIGKLLWMRFWPGLSAKYMVKPKLEKAKRKVSDVAQSVKGKTSVLVKKPSEVFGDISMRSRTSTGRANATFSANLRESLLETHNIQL